MNIIEIAVSAMVIAAIALFSCCWAIGRDHRRRQQRLEEEAWTRLTNDPDIWMDSLIRSPGTRWSESRRTFGQDAVSHPLRDGEPG